MRIRRVECDKTKGRMMSRTREIILAAGSRFRCVTTMKTSIAVVLGVLLAAPFCVAQNGNELTVPEFRQSLNDMLVMLSPRAQADYGRILAQVPDSMLAQWNQNVPDGRRFQSAAIQLRAMKEAQRYAPAPATPAMTPVTGAAMSSARFHLDMANTSPRGAIGTPPVPGYALWTPRYPSGNNWHNMVAVLPLSGDLSAANCSANYTSAMTIAVATFHGIKDAADQICEVIPDPLVVILGEGTSIPLKEICFGVSLILGAFDAGFEGFLQDCTTQTLLTGGAETEATYHNTIALWNLKFRLKVEQNLQATTPIGLFELPASQGGYLESVRAIVAETIAKMLSLTPPPNEVAALAAMAQGDSYYAANQFKLAYSSYRKAYGAAAQ